MKHTLTALVLSATLLLAGCSRATQDNFDQVETDMTREQVHALLGKPDEVNSSSLGSFSLSSETWLGRRHRISVSYANGQVKMKSITPVTEE